MVRFSEESNIREHMSRAIVFEYDQPQYNLQRKSR